MNDNLKTHDMVNRWIDVIGLKGWTIATEAIDKKSVIYEGGVPAWDQYFVGVDIDKEKMMAHIYHDRPLNDEYVVHELLHVKYPDWTEDQVNAGTELLLNQSKDKKENHCHYSGLPSPTAYQNQNKDES